MSDIAGLSEQLARDPASLVFLELADTLRKRGDLEVAVKVATRGLERHPHLPAGHDVLNYIRALYEATAPPVINERAMVQKMKKYLNFLALGAEPTGRFLHEVRRVTTEAEFFGVCAEFLAHDEPMPLEPFALELKEADVLAGEHR